MIRDPCQSRHLMAQRVSHPTLCPYLTKVKLCYVRKTLFAHTLFPNGIYPAPNTIILFHIDLITSSPAHGPSRSPSCSLLTVRPHALVPARPLPVHRSRQSPVKPVLRAREPP